MIENMVTGVTMALSFGAPMQRRAKKEQKQIKSYLTSLSEMRGGRSIPRFSSHWSKMRICSNSDRSARRTA